MKHNPKVNIFNVCFLGLQTVLPILVVSLTLLCTWVDSTELLPSSLLIPFFPLKFILADGILQFGTAHQEDWWVQGLLRFQLH